MISPGAARAAPHHTEHRLPLPTAVRRTHTAAAAGLLLSDEQCACADSRGPTGRPLGARRPEEVNCKLIRTGIVHVSLHTVHWTMETRPVDLSRRDSAQNSRYVEL